MSFESIQFAVFLSIVFMLYWFCKPKYRWIVIFAANIVFYLFSGIQYLTILVSVCAITYIFVKLNKTYKSKWVLGLGVFLDLIPLLFFKYGAFFQTNVNNIMRATHSRVYFEPIQVLLPLGISFYTFSALAFMIDSYKGKLNNNYGFLQVMTGISFFPCLIAGPIERQKKLLPQILGEQKFQYETAVYGLKRIAFGLFKKTVIADTIAIPINRVFSDVHACHGLTLLVVTILFPIEVYCDFSGYSDISIGIARLFGIELTENFRSPFFSRSYNELWRRWHISLSSWFKDYIYIPLGGSKRGKLRKALNTLIVFLLSGFWHGASWTFIIWGGLNGFAQIVESMFPRKIQGNEKRITNLLSPVVIFVIFSIFAVFFRANTVSDALFVLANMLKGIHHPTLYSAGIFEVLGMNGKKLIIIVGELWLLAWYDHTTLVRDPIQVISDKPSAVRWAIYVVFVLMIAQLSAKGAAVEFIYAAF